MAESGVGGGGVDAPTHSIIHGLGMGAGLDGISTDGAMREAIGRIMGDVADPHFHGGGDASGDGNGRWELHRGRRGRGGPAG